MFVLAKGISNLYLIDTSTNPRTVSRFDRYGDWITDELTPFDQDSIRYSTRVLVYVDAEIREYGKVVDRWTSPDIDMTRPYRKLMRRFPEQNTIVIYNLYHMIGVIV